MQSQRNSLCSARSQNSGWAPPRAPLSPHRLAKLANALGVSTPLPAMTLSASLLSSSPNLGNPPSPSNSDLPWRSVTPSTVTALNLVSPVQSKYLLHVIPPVHLPHDADTSDSTELAPPPSTASGYHTQFRRGTLVALQSTLQAQLVVIAREYALPSTIGIILYLVTVSPQSRQNSPLPSSPSCGDTGGGEPGPRLSEEIWKHIWTRVLRAELALSRSGTPNPLGLGLTVESNGPSQSLRPLVTPTRTEHSRPLAYPVTPSTSASTTSSVSDIRSHEKSAGASSPRSEPNTPDTSRSSDHGFPDIELPGLKSPSIIPILAKVEFDIDKRKATWYEPWVRSRRMRRTESRSSHRSDSRSRTIDSGGSADEKRAPYGLKLVQRMQKPPFLRSQDDSSEEEQLNNGEYAPLSESPDADAAARMTSTTGHDPLEDVFGADAETWTEIHAESSGVRRKVNDADVVELALDATSLSTTLPEQGQVEGDETDDVDDVREIMRRMSRPPLSISVPDSTESKRRSSLSTAVGKRPMPPPLVLAPISPTNNLIEGETEDFRNKDGLSLELEQEYQRSRNPGEEKRVGTLFEDLDLGLDLGDGDEEYDENDPNDRRRSQYLMKAKLDEIERTLAQFSPRQLKTAVLDENSTIMHNRNLSNTSQSRTSAPAEPPASPLHKAWPSVPYASVAKTVNGSPTRPANLPPSPPRLALNGVSTGAPKAFMPAASSSSTVPTESQVRRRELEQATYPAKIPSPSRQVNIASDSPIPLSPDPFGRHPSIYEADAAPVQSYWDPVAQTFSHDPLGPRPSVSSIDDGLGTFNSATPSSRFSADSSSVAETTKSTAPLVSVKGLKKLWRKSKPSSSALPQPPTPGRTDFQFSSSPHPPTPTDQFMALPVPNTMTRGLSGKAHVGQLQFDQESSYPPYPPSRPSLSGSRPNSPAVLLNASPQEKPGFRKSILKSWKSVAGGGSQQPTSGSEPRKSSERPVSDETIKPRRPSVLDGSIPPSPRLPEQYLLSNHVRTGSNFIERRKSAARSKAGPGRHQSSASHDLLSTIPHPRSPVIMQTPGSASSSQSQFSALSRDSHAESLETSQFEVVPPKVHPNLTYPYMTLDHE